MRWCFFFFCTTESNRRRLDLAFPRSHLVRGWPSLARGSQTRLVAARSSCATKKGNQNFCSAAPLLTPPPCCNRLPATDAPPPCSPSTPLVGPQDGGVEGELREGESVAGQRSRRGRCIHSRDEVECGREEVAMGQQGQGGVQQGKGHDATGVESLFIYLFLNNKFGSSM